MPDLARSGKPPRRIAAVLTLATAVAQGEWANDFAIPLEVPEQNFFGLRVAPTRTTWDRTTMPSVRHRSAASRSAAAASSAYSSTRCASTCSTTRTGSSALRYSGASRARTWTTGSCATCTRSTMCSASASWVATCVGIPPTGASSRAAVPGPSGMSAAPTMAGRRVSTHLPCPGGAAGHARRRRCSHLRQRQLHGRVFRRDGHARVVSASRRLGESPGG